MIRWKTILAEESSFDENKFAVLRIPAQVSINSLTLQKLQLKILGRQSNDWTEDNLGCTCGYKWFYCHNLYGTFMKRLDLPEKPTPELLLVHPYVYIADRFGNRIVEPSKMR